MSKKKPFLTKKKKKKKRTAAKTKMTKMTQSIMVDLLCIIVKDVFGAKTKELIIQGTPYPQRSIVLAELCNGATPNTNLPIRQLTDDEEKVHHLA